MWVGTHEVRAKWTSGGEGRCGRRNWLSNNGRPRWSATASTTPRARTGQHRDCHGRGWSDAAIETADIALLADDLREIDCLFGIPVARPRSKTCTEHFPVIGGQGCVCCTHICRPRVTVGGDCRHMGVTLVVVEENRHSGCQLCWLITWRSNLLHGPGGGCGSWRELFCSSRARGGSMSVSRAGR